MSKETHIYEKRPTFEMSKETYKYIIDSDKRCQKRPTNISKNLPTSKETTKMKKYL